MSEHPLRALIVQSDSSVLLDVHAPAADQTRAAIAVFAELEKSPEHIHTYRLTPLSLWNAASAGVGFDDIAAVLTDNSRYALPANVLPSIRETLERFGKLTLRASDTADDRLYLQVTDDRIRAELATHRRLAACLDPDGNGGFFVRLVDRGTIKQELIKIGYPVKDDAPLVEGDPLPIELVPRSRSGRDFHLRDYQVEAAAAFVGDGRPGTGFGTVVLPCGAGKTVVGMAIMHRLKTNTLILTTNVAAVHQWMDELLDKTDIDPGSVGEYTGDTKTIRPITVGTYQILVWRPDKQSEFPHFRIFRERKWGLIIYDEAHLLPAPVFRVTAEIQATRRLGLTATLVREDGREEDVFTLVGPKRYDVPWKELEARGWIAEASCREIRVDLPEPLKIEYAVADLRQKFRIASENPLKLRVVEELVKNHPEDPILVIGQYLDQLCIIAENLGCPLITGKTPNAERERIYGAFRRGEERIIVVSKVANFAIDLPDASVAIQVSGTFGSRQEEAQRLGRILRPKERNSWFYSIISRFTSEEGFGANRQKFLTEQGYKYSIDIWSPEELA